MKKVLLIFCLFMSFVFAGCKSAEEKAIDHLVEFTEELSQNSEGFSNEDWKSAAEEYKLILKEMDNCHFTSEQLDKIGTLKGRCSGFFTKSKLNNIIDDIQDLIDQTEGFIEGFTDALSGK